MADYIRMEITFKNDCVEDERETLFNYLSTLYKNGFGRIGEMLNYLENWMDKHAYKSTDEFIGKLSIKKAENPAAWERVQFMKHFAGIE